MADNETLATIEMVNIILIVFILALAAIYLLLMLLWVMPAIGLLIDSCKRLRSLSALREKDIDEHAVHMKGLYKERTVRYTLFVGYIIAEINVLLFLPVHPLKDLSILSKLNITNSTYFNDPIFTVGLYFLSCFFRSIFCLLFGVTLLHLRMSIKKEKYRTKKLLYQSLLGLIIVVALAIIKSIAKHFIPVITLICVILILQIVMFYLMRQVKLFLRELEWQREDTLSYHTKHSNIIKEKNWLIKHYRRILWWTVLGIQLFAFHIMLRFFAAIVKPKLTDNCEIPYNLILLTPSYISEIISLLLMITLNVYVISVVYIKNRRERKWRYNYGNCGLREPLLK